MGSKLASCPQLCSMDKWKMKIHALALKEAEIAFDLNEVPVGAVIVNGAQL